MDCAFALDFVREIVPMARLSSPPGLPSALAGFPALRDLRNGRSAPDGALIHVLSPAALLQANEVHRLAEDAAMSQARL